ncbi:DedA family protein [Bacillus spongiae]|uniref:DedA family protein n=1 Tax=Bacillus spongiae TaxID=2683610 RepID=A0ABU8HJS6_9BACI
MKSSYIEVSRLAEMFLNHIDEWGVWGIFLSLFIEGSAFPFIGTFFIVTVGFVLELSWLSVGLISILGSMFYALGSYLPYFIGYRLGHSVELKLSKENREKLEKTRITFGRYGIWGVAIASPLHFGNVVPFLAGMSKMNLSKYTLLTMLGIAPSTFLLLSVGQFYEGDKDAVIEQIVSYQTYLLIAFIILTFAYGLSKYRKRRRKQLH